MAHFLKSDPDRFIEGGPRAWRRYLANWLVPILISSTAGVALANGGGLNFPQYLVMFGGYWYLWALAAPLVYRVQLIGQGRAVWNARAVHAALHVGLLAALTALSNFYFLIVNALFLGVVPFTWTAYAARFEQDGAVFFVGVHVVKYAAAVLLCALLRQVRLRERHDLHRQQIELQNQTLVAELSEAKLTALRNQIHPHLLFNALNCIASLIETGRNDAAYAAVSDLAALLRQTLDQTHRDWVMLKEDLDLAKAYLRIAALRFDDRINWAINADPECEGERIAPLLVQPLVENAVRHGVESTAGPVRIEVAARRHGAHIELSVCDSGPGFAGDAGAANATGVGLRNLRERLLLVYGQAARLEIERPVQGGALVRIRLPRGVPAATEPAE